MVGPVLLGLWFVHSTWQCLLEGDHFSLHFYHLSQSQKCYGILMLSKVFHGELSISLSHVSVTSNDG